MGFEELLGTPHSQISCIGLVQTILGHLLPPFSDYRLHGLKLLRRIDYQESRQNDLILWLEWRAAEHLWVPCHVGIIVNPSERLVLHSGRNGRGNMVDAHVQFFHPYLESSEWPRIFLRTAR